MIDGAALARRIAERTRLAIPPHTLGGYGIGGLLTPSVLDTIGGYGIRHDTPPGYAASAVLVAIVVEPGAPERIIFIERRADLRNHPGQVAFPGGRGDADDIDATATALREAREELGILSDTISVLGLLDDVPTPSGFVITPVVGIVRGPIALVPAPEEVASVFLASIDELRAPGAHRENGVREFLGVSYTMHEYHWERWRIWGATARILHQLLSLLDGE